MSKLSEFFKQQKQILQQQQEIKRLNVELETLRVQNDSMRAGMRRCTTCEYRIDFKKRQGGENSS